MAVLVEATSVIIRLQAIHDHYMVAGSLSSGK
jgi:hypothetical protein